ncbi:MAG: acetate--CoA ligase family protein [archaeon]
MKSKEQVFKELSSIFNPNTVAVIGASREKGKIGHSVYKTMKESLKGKTYPVNPKANEILGDKSYKSIKEIPEEIDLAVFTVPAKITPMVMEECGEKGVKGAVIITSGFSEIGNKELEEKLRKKAEEHGVRIIGPNCLGILDNTTGLNTLFLPPEKLKIPKKGGIGVISQSGAVGSVMVDWCSYENFGLSRFISFGNGIDIDERKLIKFLGADPETEVIVIYLEGTKNGRELMEAAKEVTTEKPIIILKGGKTSEGSKAVSSHTGSLAGSAEVYDAAFQQSNIIQARTMLDLLDYAEVFEKQPLPKGKRVMIITNGGGYGVLSADEVINQGLKLAEIKPGLKKKLREIIPKYGDIGNPLDLLGDADSDRYKKVLKILEKAEGIDAVICVQLFQTDPMEEEAIEPVFEFNENSDKPIIVVTAGAGKVREIKEKLENDGIPVFNTPNRAVDALRSMVKYEEGKD